MKKLLVIDDDEKVREAVHLVFDKSFHVLDASCREEAMCLFIAQKPDVILLDIEFNGMPEGWEIFKEIKSHDGEVPIYLMSGNGTYKDHVLAHQADRFFEKPFNREMLFHILKEKGLIEEREES